MTLQDWQSLLKAIAVPRLPGSAQVHRVQQLLTERLEAMGFCVTRQVFETCPRRLYAASLLGSGMGLVAIMLAPVLVLPVAAWSAVVTGAVAISLVLLVVVGIANGRLPFRTGTVKATNLIATRTRRPKMWLVAHSDSKAQGWSLAGRVIAVATFGIGFLFVVLCVVLRMAGPVSAPFVSFAVILTAVGGAALSKGPLRGGSPGAVDNASGVIAVLSAAHELSAGSEIGVLITDAEEFGMEGARVWNGSGYNSGAFVNFDGIDSTGKLNLMKHEPRWRKRSLNGILLDVATLTEAVRQACSTEFVVRSAPLPVGVFVDGSVLARGGMTGVTVSRGAWATLRVVHTTLDSPERFDVASAVTAGQLVADAIRDLPMS